MINWFYSSLFVETISCEIITVLSGRDILANDFPIIGILCIWFMSFNHKVQETLMYTVFPAFAYHIRNQEMAGDAINGSCRIVSYRTEIDKLKKLKNEDVNKI